MIPSRDKRARGLASTFLRLGASGLRSRFPELSQATISLGKGGPRLIADLGTPTGLRLYRYGLVDPLADLLRGRLAPGDSVVDGGANIGLFTLVAAAAVGPQGRVIACEPSRETMPLLQANVALNGFEWVTTCAVALGERAGSAEFWSFGAGAGLSSLARPADQHVASYRVAVRTLDEVSQDAATVRLVKLDLEGAELIALRGARRLLEVDRPEWVIEVEPDHLARHGSSVAGIADLFRSADYLAYDYVVNASGACEFRSRHPEDWSAHPALLLRPREKAE
jgi:FkbM family methyltransferase